MMHGPISAGGPFLIVCLGGSAGSLDPYLTIFRNLPADTGMAFVVAQHRSTVRPDLLPKIIRSATPMPVAMVESSRFSCPIASSSCLLEKK
jgi:two-component system, chemotaxis family, CheB/CheR fusion protein